MQRASANTLKLSSRIFLAKRTLQRTLNKNVARTFTATAMTSAKSIKPNTEPPKDMAVFKNMSQIASSTSDFRTVLWTGEHSQFVLMTVPVGGDVGKEVHHVDQHLIFHSGTAKAVVNGKEDTVGPGDLVIVPAGAEHNFINTGETPLVLSTVYAPAEHDPTTKHKTQDEGEELEDAGKDEPPKWASS